MTRFRSWLLMPALLALLFTGPVRAGELLNVGDEAPSFMCYSYNESTTKRVTGSTAPALGSFLGVSPDSPRDAVLLVFMENGTNSSAEMEMLAKMQRKYSSWGMGLQVIVVGISEDAVDMNDVLAGARSVEFPVLRDRFLVVAERYGVARGSTPVAFLLTGNRPGAALTAHEEGAMKEAFLNRGYEWSVKVMSRWTGNLLSQEQAIAGSIEAVVDR